MNAKKNEIDKKKAVPRIKNVLHFLKDFSLHLLYLRTLGAHNICCDAFKVNVRIQFICIFFILPPLPSPIATIINDLAILSSSRVNICNHLTAFRYCCFCMAVAITLCTLCVCALCKCWIWCFQKKKNIAYQISKNIYFTRHLHHWHDSLLHSIEMDCGMRTPLTT